VLPQAGGRVAQLEQEVAQLRREHEALVAEFADFRRQFD
jgi:cell division protein FtsB